MKRKEPVLTTVLDSIPDWVLGLCDPPRLPPVPPMDPAFCFPEAWWVRTKNDEAAADLRRRWRERNAPDITSRQIYAEARRRRVLL